MKLAFAFGAVAATVLIVKASKLLWVTVPDYPPVPLKGEQGDVVEVHGFLKIPDVAASPSAWVTRVIAFLRISNIPYTFKPGNPLNAPRGLVPYIKHGTNVVCDCELIVRYLQHTYPHNALQDPEDTFRRGVCNAAGYTAASLTLLLERYFWVDDEGFAFMRPIFNDVPFYMRPIVTRLVRNRMIEKCKAAGVASFSGEEYDFMCWKHLCTVSDIIGDNLFLGGSKPVPADCLVFGILDVMFYAGEGLRHTKLAQEFPVLAKYVDNIRFMYFPQGLNDVGNSNVVP